MMLRPRFLQTSAVAVAMVTAHVGAAFHVTSSPAAPPRLPRTTLLSAATESAPPEAFAGGFDGDQMDALAERGELEAGLMSGRVGILGEGGGGGGNAKKKKKKPKKEKKQKPAMVARTLLQDGVVQLNGVLSESTAASLREEILDRRAAAFAAVDASDDDGEWRKHFADVLLKGKRNQRCDLLLPLKGEPGVQAALHELLVASNLLSSTILSALGGDDATLYELSSLISEPGSPRQPIHPDNPHQEHPPLLTAFVALQDITPDMGPTTFIPRSHTAEVHRAFDDVPKRDDLLRDSPSVEALLKVGDCSLFDSRALHCGGANDAVKGETRVLLYASFRNPRATEAIGNVGSIMPDIPRMTLGELKTRLTAAAQQSFDYGEKGDPFDDERERSDALRDLRSAAEDGDADAQLRLGTHHYLGERGLSQDAVEAVRWFEMAADQGLAHAQFNLGFCHLSGDGVGTGSDPERAVELFRLAADQDHPGARGAYDEAKMLVDR